MPERYQPVRPLYRSSWSGRKDFGSRKPEASVDRWREFAKAETAVASKVERGDRRLQAALGGSESGFTDRAVKILKRVEYRRALTPHDRELVASIRYMAAKRQQPIDVDRDADLFDDLYDRSPNQCNVMTFLDGEFMSVVRIHADHGDSAVLPSRLAFNDVISPLLKDGRVIVNATGIAAKLEFARKLPELPYLTLRAAWLAAEQYRGDVMTLSCIPEHQAFYQRVFGFEPLCAPRVCPQAGRSVVCMALDHRAQKADVEKRYPLFRSTEEERRNIFGASTPLRLTPGTIRPRM